MAASASARLLATRRVASFYSNVLLEQYASKPAQRLTVKELLQFGQHMSERKLLRSANYAREELPVRLAHRIAQFQQLPFVVGTNPHVNAVYELYWAAFEAFRKVPEIKTLEDNARYCELLRTQLQTHLVVIPKLAQGLNECKDNMSHEEMEKFLLRTLRARIARRLIALQHLTLSEANKAGADKAEAGHVGILATSLKARQLLEESVELAGDISRRTYGVAPAVTIDGHAEATLAGVPSHIKYVLYELLKNGMRAVVEKAGHVPLAAADLHQPPQTNNELEQSLPPLTVTIAESERDLVFRLSDLGGGIPFNLLDKVWENGYTTAAPVDFEKSMPRMAGTLSEHHHMPMAGMGLGLTIARVYAEYLGGSIRLQSMEGLGTDVYYRLRRLADDQEENIV